MFYCTPTDHNFDIPTYRNLFLCSGISSVVRRCFNKESGKSTFTEPIKIRQVEQPTETVAETVPIPKPEEKTVPPIRTMAADMKEESTEEVVSATSQEDLLQK